MSVTQWFLFITNTRAFTHSLITFIECLPWLSTKPGTEKMKISKTSHCLYLHGATDTDQIITQTYKLRGSPGVTSGRKPTCQCRRHKRHGFNPWIKKIPWMRAWQQILVFLPGESFGQRSLEGYLSTGLQRVRQDWGRLAHTHMNLRNEFFVFTCLQNAYQYCQTTHKTIWSFVCSKLIWCLCALLSPSVASDSLWPHGL